MRTISPKKTTLLLVLMVLVSAGIRLHYAWQPLPDLLRQGMADDAFYYLNIARNITRGLGSSFDGLSPTNGYHPLYALFLVPLFKLLPSSPETVARLGLSLLMVFNILTALPLYGLTARLSHPQAGLFAALLWLFNPWALIFSLGGVESAVYIFWAALSAYLYLRLLSSPDRQRYTRAIGLGACLGLSILSRSDGIFLLSAIVIAEGVQAFRNGLPSLPRLERGWLLQMLLMLGTCGVVVAPWLLWNLFTFGSLTQVSGLAVGWQTHSGALTQAAWWDRLLHSALRMASGSLYFSMQALLVGLLLLLVRFIMRRAKGVSEVNHWLAGRSKEATLRKRALWVVGVYALQIFAFYAFYLWQQQFWYFMPVLYAATVFGGIFFADLVDICASFNPRFLRFIRSFAALAVLLVGGIAWYGWQTGWMQLYPAQRNALWIAGQLSSRAEPQARIGAWNSGILGYISDRTVVNLDGVVNNTLYGYVRQRQASFFDLCALWDYIQANQLDYLTDYEDAWNGDLGTYFSGRLELWAESRSVPEAGNYPVRIYRVVKEAPTLAVQNCPGAMTLHK